MGYMTCVTILNDVFYDFEKNPEKLIQIIKNGMHTRSKKPVSYYYGNGVAVHSSVHADECQLLHVQRNATIDVLSTAECDIAPEYLVEYINEIENVEQILDSQKNKVLFLISKKIYIDIKRDGKLENVSVIDNTTLLKYIRNNIWAQAVLSENNPKYTENAIMEHFRNFANVFSFK